MREEKDDLVSQYRRIGPLRQLSPERSGVHGRRLFLFAHFQLCIANTSNCAGHSTFFLGLSFLSFATDSQCTSFLRHLPRRFLLRHVGFCLRHFFPPMCGSPRNLRIPETLCLEKNYALKRNSMERRDLEHRACFGEQVWTSPISDDFKPRGIAYVRV